MKNGIDYEQRPEARILPGLPALLVILVLASVVWLALGINPLDALAQLLGRALGFCC